MTHLHKAEKKHILTFGYGNRKDYDVFLGYLELFNVGCVVDVRISPRAWSRKWYGDKIAQLCASKGIKYISKAALGNISGNKNWIPPILEEANKALLEISNIAQSETIMLLCAEIDSSRCHRVDVAQELQKLVNVPVKHLE